MKCPACRTGENFIRTFETIQHRNMTERRKLCLKCGNAWKTIEQFLMGDKDKSTNAQLDKKANEERG